MIYLIKDPQGTIHAIATRKQDAEAMTKTLNNETELWLEEFQPPAGEATSPQT